MPTQLVAMVVGTPSESSTETLASFTPMALFVYCPTPPPEDRACDRELVFAGPSAPWHAVQG